VTRESLEAPAAASPAAWARALLDAQAAAGLLRVPRTRHGGSGSHAVVDGRHVTVFSSNDYLGLAAHPAVRAAAAEAARTAGAGSTGSRHLSGCHASINALESELAAFEGAETATIAPSGYAANVATLQALGGPDAVILSDERNHASIIDGCRLSRAHVEVFAHADLDDLERRLRRSTARSIIVSDSVFSVDGTIADVAGLAELAHRHGAWLVLDEAHATGVLGPGGRGAAAAAGIDPRDDTVVRVVTMSKALGAGGAAVCASATVRGVLLQRGRALIFSTALPHPTVAAARAALTTLRENPDLVDHLRANVATLRGALDELDPTGAAEVPIVPLLTGDPHLASRLEASLLERGHLVQAVRPPTVPTGTSRLRLTVSAAHTTEELQALAADIVELSAAA
jgi:glycine C-acetyltransferase/8-amino-7-oxononanoate synthase